MKNMRKLILPLFAVSFFMHSQSEAQIFGLFKSSTTKEISPNIAMVQVFDINEIVLGSTYEYIKEEALRKSDYKVVKEDTRYPKFFEYNYNYECRRGGKVKTPEQLKRCTIEQASKEKQVYTNYMKLQNDKTGEKIELFFTSNQTENLVYQIKYENDANKVEGIGEAYEYQRKEKLRAFLQRVYEKYGQPNVVDTEGAAQIWASDLSNPKKPVMRVYFGKIVLEDLSLYEKDEVMSKEKAQTTFKPKKYDF